MTPFRRAALAMLIVLAPWSPLDAAPVAVRLIGFKATFNPAFPDPDGSANCWVSPWHFGLHSGPTVVMVGNYESGLIWRLMRGSPYVVAGLRAAGVNGGWLEVRA